MENFIDLVLHPTRLRIVMALAGRHMTSLQLAEALGDTPQATLYRHLNRLTQAGVLEVAAERRVRGTLEKIYTLGSKGGLVNAQEFTNLSGEDHLRYFTTFVATLLDDFSRYIQNTPALDPVADGVGYQKFPLELNEEEFAEVAKGINAAIIPYLNNPPTPGRKRRIFVTAAIPVIESSGSENDSSPEVDNSKEHAE